ncbi:polyphosphate kinase [Thalassotalea sp. M1531]|uniref:Polyphosphate kinase n=1 Tax=Thalassotalea algicola TaxID=2716224 RepID=A0A7Y0Q7N6_9GAMM|nr:polyphosphate kinase [Thalassotalea algicola]NMP31220.1 polyphosphate kinase [Thalassotalea algicola]
MYKPTTIELAAPTLLEDVNLTASLEDKQRYEQKLKKWQKRMLQVQQAYFRQGRRTIIVLEGWDASGKGGAIRRLTEKLDPRGFRVYPIAAPTVEEQSKHYLYRFQTKLPAPGNIAIFDRSYYGRVLVERVEGFANEIQWQRAYQEINEFERLLVDDGVRVVKLLIHIDQEEQLKRFMERLNNPIKRWKLTEEDLRNRDKWQEYHQALNDMLTYSNTNISQWHVISGNHKWHARIQVLKTVVKAMEEGVDTTIPPLDKTLVSAAQMLLKKELV